MTKLTMGVIAIETWLEMNGINSNGLQITLSFPESHQASAAHCLMGFEFRDFIVGKRFDCALMNDGTTINKIPIKFETIKPTP
jgi:hypothetical protein